MAEGTCSLEGCGRTGKVTRGWCNRHYLSWFRHGDPLAASAPKPIKTCSVDGCERKFYGKGYCHTHYARVRTTGTAEPRTLLTDAEKAARRHAQAERRDRRARALGITCSELLCPEAPKARGLCGKHYARRRKWGSPSGHAPQQSLDVTPFSYVAPARCSVGDCEEIASSRGYCKLHLGRHRKHGDVLPRPRRRLAPLRHSATNAERFWHRVHKAGPVPPDRPRLGPCWVWLGALNSDGYGLFKPKKAPYRSAHRYAWSMLGLPLVAGLTLDHLCRRRDCVRPSHLEQVSHAENVARSRSVCIENGQKTHCKEGHPFDDANTLTHRPGARGCRACYNAWRRRRRATLRLSRKDQAVAVAYKVAIAADPCRYCGSRGEQDDHYFPVAKGGGGKWWNLARSCRKCNQAKGTACGTWFLLRRGVAVR